MPPCARRWSRAGPSGPNPFLPSPRHWKAGSSFDLAKTAVDEGAALTTPVRLLIGGAPFVSIHTRLREHAATFDRLFTARQEALASASE